MFPVFVKVGFERFNLLNVTKVSDYNDHVYVYFSRDHYMSLSITAAEWDALVKEALENEKGTMLCP